MSALFVLLFEILKSCLKLTCTGTDILETWAFHINYFINRFKVLYFTTYQGFISKKNLTNLADNKASSLYNLSTVSDQNKVQ